MAEKRKRIADDDYEVSVQKRVLKHIYGKKFWGPYLSERQWCTVREETLGNCWTSASYDTIAHGSYRWGEDGIFGLSDEEQKLCMGLSLWNGKDPIVKERFFGLTGPQGNHGEDVKELYYYLDNDPDHNYMRAVYLYPQSEFPYKELITKNRNRTPDDGEYEILDTGVFNDNYWQIQVEYAKPVNEVILCKYTITNRSSQSSTLEVTPQLWFRNYYDVKSMTEIPCFQKMEEEGVVLLHYELGKFTVKFSQSLNGCNPAIKLVENLNNSTVPTRCSVTYKLKVEAGGHDIIQWELSPFHDKETTCVSNNYSMQEMRLKGDNFYNNLYDPNWSDKERHIAKGAWSGLLWNKQFYYYDIDEWYTKGQAKERKGQTEIDKPGNWDVKERNIKWRKHFKAHDILSVPDKWEFPWFASWDTCFQMIPFCRLDPDFAKSQLLLLLSERYMSPEGQIPGCEFNFEDNNPPIHAWTCLKVFRMTGGTDFTFLANSYKKLLKNYQWWRTNLYCSGSHMFCGGFLGLDNISVFDRGNPPDGYTIKQADATAWMALFALSMLEIVIELDKIGDTRSNNNVQEDIVRYLTDFFGICKQMNKNIEDGGLWNPKMNFYNDVLVERSTKQCIPIEVKSLVGLLPLVACCKISHSALKSAGLSSQIATEFSHVIQCPGEDVYFLTCVPEERIGVLLDCMFDEGEFLSQFGIRSLSKVHTKSYTLKLPVITESLKSLAKGDNSMEKETTTITESVVHYSPQMPLMATDAAHHSTQDNCGAIGDKYPPKDVYKASEDDIYHGTKDKSTTKGDKSLRKEDSVTTKQFSLHYTPGESDSAIMGGNSNWRGPIWICANYILLDTIEKIHSGLGNRVTVQYPTSKSRANLDWAKKDVCKRLVSIFLPDVFTGARPLHGEYKQYTVDSWKSFIPYYEYFHGDTGRGCGASHQTGWTSLITEILYKLYR